MRLVDYKCSSNMIGQKVKYCSLILANTSNLLIPYFGIGQWHTQVIENPNWTKTVSFIFKDDKDFKVFTKNAKTVSGYKNNHPPTAYFIIIIISENSIVV